MDDGAGTLQLCCVHCWITNYKFLYQFCPPDCIWLDGSGLSYSMYLAMKGFFFYSSFMVFLQFYVMICGRNVDFKYILYIRLQQLLS